MVVIPCDALKFRAPWVAEKELAFACEVPEPSDRLPDGAVIDIPVAPLILSLDPVII